TITAVLSYYNVAKISVNKVGQGIELEENYRRDIETLLLKDIVNGSELKNILIYFKDDKRVNINILKYVAFKADGNVDIISLGDNYNEVNIVEKDNVKKNNFDNILKNIIP
ncbi:MAG: hypothetical protein RSF67_04165, partial [Clostridia bacterium]